MKKKIKVLMLGPGRNNKGGIVTVVNQYFENGLSDIVQLKYISTAKEGNIFSKYFEFCKGMIIFLFNSCNYDIVHIHMSSRGSYRRKRIFVKLAKNIFRKKVIIHLHGSEFRKFYKEECNIKQKNDIFKIFKLADKIIVLSNEWKEFISTIVDEEQIKVIYNAVPIGLIHKDYSDENIVFLGRLGERKGVYDLLEILPKLIQKYPNLKVYLAGDGEIEKCKEICKRRKMESAVKVLGWLDEKQKKELLAKSSIFVLPSYNEGLPMAMLEAMANGFAVVVSKAGGIGSVINSGENGLLIEAGNKEELFISLNKLLENKKYKEQLGYRAYETVKENYGIHKHIQEIYVLYHEI